jgi:hypothetical protein
MVNGEKTKTEKNKLWYQLKLCLRQSTLKKCWKDPTGFLVLYISRQESEVSDYTLQGRVRQFTGREKRITQVVRNVHAHCRFLSCNYKHIEWASLRSIFFKNIIKSRNYVALSWFWYFYRSQLRCYVKKESNEEPRKRVCDQRNFRLCGCRVNATVAPRSKKGSKNTSLSNVT